MDAVRDFFLDEAKQQGWKVTGSDLSSWSGDYAKNNFGIHVDKGDFTQMNYPEHHFDVIVMLDVIEHLENPLEALQSVERILKPGGALYLSTPNINSGISRKPGSNQGHPPGL